MVLPKGSVLCILCRGAINLKSGDLGKFKKHLESVHDTLYDMDLLISLAFLEGGEKEGIVENMFPRIKNFFKSVKHSSENYFDEKLSIEKRLLEEEDEEEESLNSRKRIRREEVKVSDKEEVDTISEDGLDQSIIDVLENNSISDDDSEDSDNDDEQDEALPPPEVGLSHCDLCQLSLPVSSFNSHMELHKNETLSDDLSELEQDDLADKDEISNNDTEYIDDFVGDKQSTSAMNSEFSKCEVCDKELKKKNMSRHKRRLHGIYNSQNILEKVNSAGSDIAVHDSSFEDISAEESSNQEDKGDPSFQMNGPSAPVRCDVCLKPMQKKSLARHMTNLHPTEKSRGGNYSSPASTEDTNSIGTDSFINNSVLEDQEYDYRCKICFTRFQALQGVKNHVKEAHDIDYEDLETIDDKEMKVSREGAIRKLKTELILQESEQEGTTLDEICVESENESGPDSKLQCEMCDFQFTRKDSLTRHYRNAHRKAY